MKEKKACTVNLLSAESKESTTLRRVLSTRRLKRPKTKDKLIAFPTPKKGDRVGAAVAKGNDRREGRKIASVQQFCAQLRRPARGETDTTNPRHENTKKRRDDTAKEREKLLSVNAGGANIDRKEKKRSVVVYRDFYSPAEPRRKDVRQYSHSTLVVDYRAPKKGGKRGLRVILRPAVKIEEPEHWCVQQTRENVPKKGGGREAPASLVPGRERKADPRGLRRFVLPDA